MDFAIVHNINRCLSDRKHIVFDHCVLGHQETSPYTLQSP